MASIQDRVYQVVVDQLGVAEKEIANDKSFTEDLGADSLDIVELVMALEQEFEVEIPDEEAENIGTIQGAIDHLTKKLEPKA